MKAPEMARKVLEVLASLEAITEAEMAEVEAASGSGSAGGRGAAADRMRARVWAERELVALHGGDHVCADPGMPWLATPYEGSDVGEDDGGVDAGAGSEPCWTLRWLARAHQVIGMPVRDGQPATAAVGRGVVGDRFEELR